MYQVSSNDSLRCRAIK